MTCDCTRFKCDTNKRNFNILYCVDCGVGTIDISKAKGMIPQVKINKNM